MPQAVFISHSSKDEMLIKTICKFFEDRGIDYWVSSKDISAGSDWSESIIDAIENCSLVVLVYSRHSNVSPQVKRELERAVHLNKPIVPFKIDQSPLSKSMQYFISTQHWLEATDPPIEPHVSRLAEIVLKIQSGDAEGERLIRQYTPRKPYWNMPRLVGVGIAAAFLIAATFWIVLSVVQKEKLAAQQAAREQELLEEDRQSVKAAEEKAVATKAQTYALAEFTEARNARLEGDQFAEAGNLADGKERWTAAVELFEHAARSAPKRERVALAKAAFLEELSSHRPESYDRMSKPWQDLVLLVGRAEEFSQEDNHAEAVNAFQRAKEAVITTIPIYHKLRSITQIDLCICNPDTFFI